MNNGYGHILTVIRRCSRYFYDIVCIELELSRDMYCCSRYCCGVELTWRWNEGSCQSCSWSAEQGTSMNFSVSQFVPENLVVRDTFSRPVQHQPAHSQHPG